MPNVGVGGSMPSGPTKNELLAKVCPSCKVPMHVHLTDKEITFVGCDPFITNIKMKKNDKQEILITGTRSTKTVVCSGCRKNHRLTSFEEVKDGSGQN